MAVKDTTKKLAEKSMGLDTNGYRGSQAQKEAIKEFIKNWKDFDGLEDAGCQPFWIDIIEKIFGVPTNNKNFLPQYQVEKRGNKVRIDVLLPETNVLIEQKAPNVSLDSKTKHSGEEIDAYEQAKKYDECLAYGKHARYIITCNFKEFRCYDLSKENTDRHQYISFTFDEFVKDPYKLAFIVKEPETKLGGDDDITFKAGAIIGELYTKLREQYETVYNPISEGILQDLNKLCVRLVFCFYAEDVYLFGNEKNYFQHYIDDKSADDIGEALGKVFDTLNKPESKRGNFFNKSLGKFPYLNCGLFEGTIEIPYFTEELKTLLHKASDYDWSKIKPAIFGGLFESTLYKRERRAGGMHYTEPENIHKVIDSLFLNDLYKEFEDIKNDKNLTNIAKFQALAAFQTKLANLKFLDPACGSGNFLTETYTCIRRLENKVLIAMNPKIEETGQKILLYENNQNGTYNSVRVTIDNFYGIEINDFACDVANVALWIAEAQMKEETINEVGYVGDTEKLPIKTAAHIHCANACRIDWNEVCPKPDKTDPTQSDIKIYVIGNPPFVGARYKDRLNTDENFDKHQAEDMNIVYGKDWDGLNNIDYVGCWYKLTHEYIKGTDISCAFVSTNSITQGIQVAPLWSAVKGIEILFAYRTFIWKSQSNDKANVHCVIIGFSDKHKVGLKPIINSDGTIEMAEYISPYLMASKNMSYLTERSKPLQPDTPQITMGSMANDNKGALSNFSNERYDKIIKEYPSAVKLFKRFIGADEYLSDEIRWCLWLNNINPMDYMNIPPIMEAIEITKQTRLQSTRGATRKLAEKPMFKELSFLVKFVNLILLI